MNIIQIIIYLIIIGLVIYAVASVFQALFWTISPLSAVGFVISIGVAIWRRHITIEKGFENIKILLFIFVGSVTSHIAIGELQNVWQSIIAGNLVGAAIIGLIVFILYIKGREVSNRNG